MTALPLNEPLNAKFADSFTTTDQDVQELHTPKPETRWCLLELPKEQLAALEKGESFYLQAQTGGKGIEDGGVALATDQATFSLEFLENSNSLFVASIGENPKYIAQVAVVALESKENVEPSNTTEAPKEGAAEAAEAPQEGAAEAAADPGKSAEAPKDGAAGPTAEPGKSTEGEKGEKVEKAQKKVFTAAGDLPATRLLAEVFAQCRGNMVAKSVKVNQVRLRELLADQPLSADAPEEDAGEQPPMLSKQHLAYQMAASAVELQALLDEGPYVEVDGIWRFLPTGLESEIIDATVSLVTVRGWNLEDLDPDLLLTDVQEHVGKHAVPSVEVLRTAFRNVKVTPVAEKAAVETAVDTTTNSGAAEVASVAASAAEGTPSGDAAESGRPPRLALDKAKLDRFQLVQLLRKPPSEVRSRFELPAPEPKAKRARVGPGAGRGGDGLQLSELAAALQSLSGAAEALGKEQLAELLGESAYMNELEGTVHNLPPSMLAAEPLDRLKRLLDLTSHWRAERLEALLTTVLPVGTKVAGWILKRTRAVHVEIELGKEERFLTKKFNL